jgi:ABC-type transport system involved in multi-copper enzyme maturation permease subunit
MRGIAAKFGLPLLSKELIEQAARKRTYVIRVLYAVMLFLSAFLFFFDILKARTNSPLAVLGKGREMFETLVYLQFAGIYLFMPAITCGVVTLEKERASLPLLFLTRLGPWTIVVEKLLSRVIPMLGFLLLSLPLLGFAYTLGGISAIQIAGAMWMLFLTVFQMGTLALLCSAYFRTTVGAFIGSYLLGVGMLFGPALVWLTAHSIGLNVDAFLNSFNSGPRIVFVPVMVLPFCGFAMWIDGPPAFRTSSHFWPVVVQSGLILTGSGLCLALARRYLVRRAFLPPRNILLGMFKAIDRIYHRLNDNPLTRGIVLGGHETSVPEGEPVAWRETQKRSLGRVRYLVRVFLMLEIPVAALCFFIAFPGAGSQRSELEFMAGILFVLWGIAVLMVAVQSASLIAGEKSHQTLDVLCTTPLAGREIVLQKFRAVSRLMCVLLAPFFTIFYFHCAAKWNMGTYFNRFSRPFEMPLYLACSLLSVATYLPLVAWLSIAAGLAFRTQARAIIGATGGLVAWCVAPVLLITMPLAIMLNRPPWEYRQLIACTSLLSPAAIIPFNEFDDLHEFGEVPWAAVLLNFALYALLLSTVRFLCLRKADRWLGRTVGEGRVRRRA